MKLCCEGEQARKRGDTPVFAARKQISIIFYPKNSEIRRSAENHIPASRQQAMHETKLSQPDEGTRTNRNAAHLDTD